MKYILGIAGFIGSGKTTAGKFFASLGADYIDADEIVDELYQKGEEGYRKILNFFGEEYFTASGELNRKKLALTVFQDPKKLRILQDLIHPFVTNRIQKMIHQSSGKVIAVEAIFFQKKNLQSLITGLLWIDCRKDRAFERINKERKMDRTLFEKILRLQLKPSKIDFVVENNGTKKDFEKELKKIWKTVSAGDAGSPVSPSRN